MSTALLWGLGALAGHTVTHYNMSLMPPPRVAGATPASWTNHSVWAAVGCAVCERMRGGGGGAAEPTLPGGLPSVAPVTDPAAESLVTRPGRPSGQRGRGCQDRSTRRPGPCALDFLLLPN